MWEEGESILKLQTRLREISTEKEEIEKLKKKAKQVKKQSSNAGSKPPVPTDGFNSQKQSCGLPIINENSEFDFEESEFNNIDKNEQREIYQFK